jgi:GDP-L-fucose synthase
MFKNVKILVTGGTGMIGRALVNKLSKLGAEVTIASLDLPKQGDSLLEQAQFVQMDLRSREDCASISRNQEIVFHLAGIKGSPKMTMSQPATFFTNTLLFNLNMMDAARKSGVKKYLFTSSVGVYAPSNIFYEDSVWTTFPSENDKFAGYAKRMGELQAEAYKIEYGWDAVSIVRPANVYGPYDNFDPSTGMVIPSLIARFASDENPIKVWGDGRALRDFIYCDDVANGMIKVVEDDYHLPVNLGSGKAISIREVVENINNHFPNKDVAWDASMPTGDDIRCMDTSRALSIGIQPTENIESGISKTINWYLNRRFDSDERYNAFTEAKKNR